MTGKTINITWRDENYGPVSGAVAFRAAIEPHPSEAASRKIQRAYKEAGFELNFNRQAWIAEENSDEAPEKLVEGLTALGYEVYSQGAIPSSISEEQALEAETPGSSPKL